MEAIPSEFYIDQGAPNKNEESLVHTEASHDVRQVYEGDVDMQMHHDKSEAQVRWFKYFG